MEPGTYDLHDLAISLVKQGQGTNYVIVKDILHERTINNDDTWANAELIIAPSLDPYIEELMEAGRNRYNEGLIKDNAFEIVHIGDYIETTTYTFHSLCEGDYERLEEALTDPPSYVDFKGPLGSYQLRVYGPHQPEKKELGGLSHSELLDRYNIAMGPKSKVRILTSKDPDLDNRIRSLYKLYTDVAMCPEQWSIKAIQDRYGDYKVARYTYDRGLCQRVPDSEQSFVDYVDKVRSNQEAMNPYYGEGRYYLYYNPSKLIDTDPHPKLYKAEEASP